MVPQPPASSMLAIDIHTLLLVSTLILGSMGLLFLVSWWDDRTARERLDWGLGFLILVPGVVLLSLRDRIGDVWSIAIANAIILASYGLLYTGARRFCGRKPGWGVALCGAGLWLFLCRWPMFMERFDLRVIAASVLCAAYCAMVARTLQRDAGGERLPSRGRAIAAFATVGAILTLRGILMMIAPVELRGLASIESSWVTWLGLGVLVVGLICAHFLLAMSSERSNMHHRRAAERDDLTGALSRRAFVTRARERLERAPDAGTLMFFDIDHFKAINDTHGHALGDEVLIAFARLVEEGLGPEDLFARWGGEEFVLFLADRDFVAGRRVAEEIRRAFARLAIGEDERPLGVTVSVGLAAPALTGPDLDHLIACADAGVYAAKRAGRDRVEAVGAPTLATSSA